MANPIKTSDLYQDTGELKELIAQVKRLTELRDIEIQRAVELDKKMDTLNGSTAAQRQEIEAANKQTAKLEKLLEKYNESLDENEIKIQAVRNAQRQLNQLNKLEAKLLASKEGSYNRLSAQYSINKIKLNQMTAEERRSTKAGRELEQQSKAIYEEMNRLQEVTGKHTLKVGDYKSALEGLPGPLGAARAGLSGLGQSFKALLANPIVAVIAAISGGLLVLGRAFGRSEKGAELLRKGTAVVNAVMSKLVKISVQVFDGITKAFSDPVQTLKDFGKALVDNVVNRFNALVKSFGFLGVAINRLFNSDFKGAAAAGEQALYNLNDAVGIFGNETRKNLIDAVKMAADEIQKEVDAFTKLEAAKIAAIRANRELTKTVERLTTAEELNNVIAGDTTRSFAEREAAAEKARAALERRAAAEIQIARNNLSVINQELSLRRANGEQVEQLLDAQINAYRELAAAERELTTATAENEKERRELKQDRLERDLDILIDGFDNQKTINERLIADETKTFEEREALLAKTQQLADASFAKQIETIKQFTDAQIDANELIGESDAVVLNEKIRALGLSEIIEGRLLEIVRDRKTANQELAQTEKELAAAKAKAQAEELKAARQIALTRADQEQALRESEIDILIATEEEKTRLRLQAERDRLQKVLAINKQFGGDLTDLQVQTIQNQIKKIDQELTATIEDADSGGAKSIYDIFGFNLSSEQQQGINETIGFLKTQLSDLTQSRIEAANAAVQAATTEVDQLQRALEIEIQNRNAGEANRVESAKRELAAAKKNQDEALREQQRAQRAQLALQSIEQSANLVTASTKIWASLSGIPVVGPTLAIAAIGLMWGSFIASKVRAAQLTRQEFGGGGYRELNFGGRHGSGNDISLGVDQNGVSLFAERGESFAVFNRQAVKKYGDRLPDIVRAINSGHLSDQSRALAAGALQQIAIEANSDTRAMEKELRAIRAQGEGKQYYQDANGRQVVRYKNVTTTYV
jgi:predicted nucleotidyltransferase